MNKIRNEIIDLIRGNRFLDGIDISTKLHIPIDTTYKELDILIKDGVIRKIYYGLQTRYELMEKS